MPRYNRKTAYKAIFHNRILNMQNMLSSVSENNQVIASYGYNGMGERVSRTIGGNTTGYVNDGLHNILEMSGGNVSAINTYGSNIDEIISRSSQGKIFNYLLDPRNNVSKVMEGTNIQGLNFGVFGKGSENSLNNAQPFGFAGRPFDSETGTYYNRMRQYNPEIGRFTQSDPIGMRDGFNTYAYVSNNPMRFFDPMGLSKQSNGQTGSDAVAPMNPNDIYQAQQNSVFSAIKNIFEAIGNFSLIPSAYGDEEELNSNGYPTRVGPNGEVIIELPEIVVTENPQNAATAQDVQQSTFGKWLSDMGNGTTMLVSDIWNDVTAWGDKMADGTIPFIEAMGDQALSSMVQAYNMAKDKLAGPASDVTEWLSDVGQMAYGYGMGGLYKAQALINEGLTHFYNFEMGVDNAVDNYVDMTATAIEKGMEMENSFYQWNYGMSRDDYQNLSLWDQLRNPGKFESAINPLSRMFVFDQDIKNAVVTGAENLYAIPVQVNEFAFDFLPNYLENFGKNRYEMPDLGANTALRSIFGLPARGTNENDLSGHVSGTMLDATEYQVGKLLEPTHFIDDFLTPNPSFAIGSLTFKPEGTLEIGKYIGNELQVNETLYQGTLLKNSSTLASAGGKALWVVATIGNLENALKGLSNAVGSWNNRNAEQFTRDIAYMASDTTAVVAGNQYWAAFVPITVRGIDEIIVMPVTDISSWTYQQYQDWASGSNAN